MPLNIVKYPSKIFLKALIKEACSFTFTESGAFGCKHRKAGEYCRYFLSCIRKGNRRSALKA